MTHFTFVITGANRGFGKAICEAVAEKFFEDCTIFMLGRNEEQLKQVSSSLSPVLTVSYTNYDCMNFNPDNLKSFMSNHKQVLCPPNKDTSVTFVHNAGTLGEPGLKISQLATRQCTEYYGVNVAAPIELNNVLMNFFFQNVKKTAVVNITSLSGIQPMASLALYCSSRAAREMFFRVFALEYKDVKVLSYSPGPLESEMFHKIRTDTYDADMKKAFEGVTTLEPIESARKLIEILVNDEFQSGAHIDYFD